MKITMFVLPCFLFFSTACFVTLQSQKKPLDEPSQVVQLLDGVIQPRFQQRAGMFGLSRIVTLFGHEAVGNLGEVEPAEEKQLQEAQLLRRDYWVGMVHLPHTPGQIKAPNNSTKIVSGSRAERTTVTRLTLIGMYDVAKQKTKRVAWQDEKEKKWFLELEKTAKMNLPKTKNGKPADIEQGNWKIALRPVLANHSTCLDCHQGAKQGEVLGVMVYAVDKQKR